MDDIIDASFVNLVHIVPFYVVKVDNDERKELIIAVRGTLSIKVSEIFGVITQTCHIRNDNCNCHDVLYTYNVTKYLATLQYASVLQNNYDIMSMIGLGNNTSINTDKKTTTDRNQQEPTLCVTSTMVHIKQTDYDCELMYCSPYGNHVIVYKNMSILNSRTKFSMSSSRLTVL